MVRLTEDMIVARTRVSDMGHVKKLNCWGAELTDVSVLRKLTNVEVLSLSVNCISTLEDISHCKNLQELYIRKNKVPDISEICWLKDLARLKNLWLEENPCSEGGAELYRLTVVKTLPQLQKLDNSAVTSEEMAEAMRRGLDLCHPLDGGGVSGGAPPPQHSQQQQATSEDRRMSRSQQEERIDERKNSRGPYYEPEERQEERKPARGPYYEPEYEQQQSMRRESVQSPSRRVSNQVFEESRMTYSQSPVSRTPDEDLRRMSIREEGGRYSEESNRPQRCSYSGPPSDAGYRGAPPGQYMDSPSSSSSGRAYNEGRSSYGNGNYQEYSHSRQSQLTQAEMHAVVNHHYNTTYRQVDQQLESAQQLLSQRRSSSPNVRPYPIRPKNRNSNVLSAILCLIKEIDGPSLEVVEMAVRCRMEELED